MMLRHATRYIWTGIRWTQLPATVLALALVFVCRQPVAAHGTGGALRIDSASIGPYTVLIWTSPNILRPGEVHVETAVFRGRSRMIDCRIAVQITSLDNREQTWRVEAGAANAANEFRHEAAFQLDNAGRYEVSVSVRDGLARGGEAAFEMEIIQLSGLVQGFIYLQVGIVALAAFWIAKSGVELFRRQASESGFREF